MPADTNASPAAGSAEHRGRGVVATHEVHGDAMPGADARSGGEDLGEQRVGERDGVAQLIGPVPGVVPFEQTGPGPARRTPILVGVVSAAAALVLVLAAGVWWWGSRSDPDPTDRARTVSAAESAPRSPVALPVDGEHALIRVLDSGDLGVEQWVRRADGIGTLMLAPPDGTRVHDLSVVAGSRPVEAPTSLDGATEISFPAGSTLYLSYRLSGALELSDDNRALARADLGGVSGTSPACRRSTSSAPPCCRWRARRWTATRYPFRAVPTPG